MQCLRDDYVAVIILIYFYKCYFLACFQLILVSSISLIVIPQNGKQHLHAQKKSTVKSIIVVFLLKDHTYCNYKIKDKRKDILPSL